MNYFGAWSISGNFVALLLLLQLHEPCVCSAVSGCYWFLYISAFMLCYICSFLYVCSIVIYISPPCLRAGGNYLALLRLHRRISLSAPMQPHHPHHQSHPNNPEPTSGSVAGTRGGDGGYEVLGSGAAAALEDAARLLRRVGDEAASAAIRQATESISRSVS